MCIPAAKLIRRRSDTQIAFAATQTDILLTRCCQGLCVLSSVRIVAGAVPSCVSRRRLTSTYALALLLPVLHPRTPFRSAFQTTLELAFGFFLTTVTTDQPQALVASASPSSYHHHHHTLLVLRDSHIPRPRPRQRQHQAEQRPTGIASLSLLFSLSLSFSLLLR